MAGPLTSLKILDFSTLLPGPFATMLLADLGADVVRVEAPRRPDPVRYKPPFKGSTSAWHALLGRSKRSIYLDLKQPGAGAVVARLVQQYDVLLEQFRPGVMDRLGVGYETLHEANPRLIYCSLTGYGQTGPYRDRAGHDINYLALSGVASHSGRAGQGPPPLGVQLADVGAGSYGAVLGILAAVIHRQQTGEGQFVDVSMLDGALAWNALAAADWLASGNNPQREGSLLNGGSPYDYYQTSDGHYLAVGSLEPKFFAGLCEAIGRPALAGQMVGLDPAGTAAVKRQIQERLAQRPLQEWLDLFSELDICVEPVLTTSQALEHPQTVAREMVVEVPDQAGNPQRQVAHPLKFSATPPDYRHTGTAAGIHTEQILQEAGYSQNDIDHLRRQGILG